MTGFVFLLAGVIQAAIAIRGTIETRKNFSWYSLLLLIVVYGLAYDSLILSAGNFIGEGNLLQTLNAIRFSVHALFTPTLIITAFGMLKRLNVKFANSKIWHGFFCTLASGLIVLGAYESILNIDLAPVLENGVLRYVNVFEFMKGPPLPAVLTVIIVLITGIFLWRRIKWPFLFITSAIMFLAAALPSRLLVWQSLGELVFAGGLVWTEIHILTRSDSDNSFHT